MVAGTFRELLADESKKRVEEAINDEKRTVLGGALPSHEQYRYHCGVIKGLELALAAIDGAMTDLQKG